MENSCTHTLPVVLSLTKRAAFTLQTLTAQARPRPLRWARVLMLASLALLLCGAQTRAQSALDGFDPGENGSVSAIVVQADGKIVVGGSFINLASGGSGISNRIYIGRLNADGTLDTTFDPGANNLVHALAIQADGKILVGGEFSTLGGGGSGTTTRNRIGRLNTDGSLDTSFNPGANDTVNAIAVQADGKILVGGLFTTLGGGGTGTTTRNRIGRLNPDGSLDTTFDPGANSFINTLALQADGKTLVVGAFTTLGGGGTGTTTRNRIGRLNADGSLDTSFDPGANGTVRALAVQADGKILVGGLFGTIGGGGTGTTARNGIGRLNADGSLDTAFNPGMNNFVNVFAVQADGKILVGGSFSTIGGATTTLNFIERLNPDGTLDTPFDPGANNAVRAFAVQADGKILVGGDFGTLGGGGFGTATRKGIGRLYADGSLDTTFNPGANGEVLAISLQADGKILVGGFFTMLGGGGTGMTPRFRIGRLNPDGSLDSTFNPGANGSVFAIGVQPDGKIIVGGNFTMLGGGGTGTTPRNGIGRLNADGSLDTTFNPGANDAVLAISVQSDGKIIVGGDFTMLGGGTGTTMRNKIGRLNPDGSIDTTFDPGANFNVLAISVQPDGKILVGGSFNMLGGGGTGATTRNRLGRLNADGSLDTTFNPGANNVVQAVSVQSDGKILVGGQFTMLGGGGTGTTMRNKIGRLNPDGSLDTTFNPGANDTVQAISVQADGKILVGGYFTMLGGGGTGMTSRISIGRLNPDGTLDSTFNPGANNIVYALALQADGKILAGGNFTMLGGGGMGTTTRNKIGRLTNTDAALQNLSVSFNGTSVRWQRSGSSPELERVTFELSTDGIAFTPIGNATRAGSNWLLTSLNLPTQQNIYVRARGFYHTCYETGSYSVVESVRNAYITATSNSTLFDFDGDKLSDVSIWNPSNQTWYILQSSDNITRLQPGWGNGSLGDIPVPADYDGDGHCDIAVWRPSDGNFYVIKSQTNAPAIRNWGGGSDVPVPADYDGDGKADYAVFRPGDGNWYIVNSATNAVTVRNWGLSNDKPMPRDYDGDGRADIAVFRPSEGNWYVINSASNTVTLQSWGNSTDKVVPADYDGDGRADLAIFRPSEGNWYIRKSTGGVTVRNWGNSGDTPVPADYDGDGLTDIAIFRPSEGNWYIIKSASNTVGVFYLGTSTDVPAPSTIVR